MASLNVRERRLDAKIAYVGAALSGRATNLAMLGTTALEGDVLELFWKPAVETTFRDCDVRVQLVTSRGDAEASQIASLLEDADGVVFVADADPAARDRNRRSLEMVRAAIAARSLPVVVQVNKMDLPDAVTSENLAADLALGAWPCIEATATRGQGVVETVERALESVLDTLRRDSVNDEMITEGRSTTAARGAAREGNPLLTALRQVLRETVTAEVDELETRMAGRFAKLLEQQTAAVRQMAEENARVREENSRVISMLEILLTSVSGIVDPTAEVASLRAAVTALQAAVRTSSGEITRALETSTRSERDQIGTATTTLSAQMKKAFDGFAAETKAIVTEAKAISAETKTMSAEVKATSAAVKATAADAKAAADGTKHAPRLDQVDTLLKREVREAVAHLSRRVDGSHEATANATSEVRAILEMIVEEMKKPKKSWFT